MGLLCRCFSTLCKLLVIHHIFWSFEIFLVILKHRINPRYVPFYGDFDSILQGF